MGKNLSIIPFAPLLSCESLQKGTKARRGPYKVRGKCQTNCGLDMGFRLEFVRTLAFKFVSFTTLVIALIVIFFSWYLIRNERKLLNDELIRRGVSITKSIATNCQYGVYTENYEILNNFIINAMSEKDVVYAFIANKDGVILTHSDPVKIGSTFNFEREIGDVKIKKPLGLKNQNIYDISMHIKLDVGKLKSDSGISKFTIQDLLDRGIRIKDELLGFVSVGISDSYLEENFIRIKRNIITFTLITIIVGIVLSILFADKIVRPVKELSRVASAIARGDLEQRVSYFSDDEMGDLAVIFNKMSEDLKVSREEIENYSKNLENMVHERTQELEETNKELQGTKELYRKLSVIDGLTGIYNRRYFEEVLNKEFERVKRYSRPISLLMIDLDHFKKINDTYGHPAGDYILKELSNVLSKFVRTVDFVARYGGEEFCVILFETERKDAIRLSERLVKLIDQKKFPAFGNLPELHLTISIGIATYPEDAKTREGLIKKADEALYQAKILGRNRFYFFINEQII